MLILACLLCPALLCAQKEKREPLNQAQIDQIRAASIDPALRVSLYVKFLNEHAETIRGLSQRGHSKMRQQRLDDALQDFTALMDELGDNLDLYSARKADLRKALKPLGEATERWLKVLHALLPEPGFELAQKEAIESGQDLADQAPRLLGEQTAYFAQHPEQVGQERYEPK